MEYGPRSLFDFFMSSHPDSLSHTPGGNIDRSPSVLNEAFLASSSRARASLPEQYRTHFDELREGILAFCTEFQIPATDLKDTKTFGVSLNTHSPRIPLERIEKVLFLFEHLEYLLIHKEPLKEESQALKEIEPLYNLTEQYTAQVNFLEQVGILKGGVIRGIDGKKYPVPTLEQIAEHLYDPERRDFFEIKREQGFTKLLLVPFGMRLHTLIFLFEDFLVDYQKTHPEFSIDGSKPFEGLSAYEEADVRGDDMVYFPEVFDQMKHRGKTKLKILQEQRASSESVTPGWRVHLFQPSNPTDIHSPGFAPIFGQREEKISSQEVPRPPLKEGAPASRYLFILQEAQKNPKSPYHGESGMTPEDWILAFMRHLQETGEPLDKSKDYAKSVSFLIGAFLNVSACVPCAYWNGGLGRAALDRTFSILMDPRAGVRTSVII